MDFIIYGQDKLIFENICIVLFLGFPSALNGGLYERLKRREKHPSFFVAFCTLSGII